MFGQPHYDAMNSFVNHTLDRAGTAVVAHRGSGGGSVAVNTSLAVRAAQLQGADMVGLDVAASADGEFYCFHDGHEPELLGIPANLQSLTAEQIDTARYHWVDRPGRPAQVEHLLPLLSGLRDRIPIVIDRSWWRWPNLLKALDGLIMAHQLILKCPAWEATAIDRLRSFKVKFPFMPICATPEDLELVTADPKLNTIGVELITTVRSHPWFDPDVISDIHERNLFAFVNTETLNTGVPLFGDLDDELALCRGPEAAWGPIFDLGIDAIQTDWPAILRDYRNERVAEHTPARRAR